MWSVSYCILVFRVLRIICGVSQIYDRSLLAIYIMSLLKQFWMHPFPVSETVARTGERLWTRDTFVGALSCVLIDVEFEVLAPLELLLAIWTRFRWIVLLFCFGVWCCSFLLGFSVILRSRLSVLTPFDQMGQHVILQLNIGHKSFWTGGAFEWGVKNILEPLAMKLLNRKFSLDRPKRWKSLTFSLQMSSFRSTLMVLESSVSSSGRNKDGSTLTSISVTE